MKNATTKQNSVTQQGDFSGNLNDKKCLLKKRESKPKEFDTKYSYKIFLDKLII